MGKWLAVAAVAILILLLILWRQLDDSEATPIKAPERKPAVAVVNDPLVPQLTAEQKAKIAKAQAMAAETVVPPGKQVMDMGSDLFYKHFIDIIPKRLWKDAAVCYEGKLGTRSRDAKYKLAFNVVVRNGKATVQDIHVANDEDGKPVNTINDPAIESCFFQHVARYQWDANEDMPDGYVIPDYEYPDELLIRPERSKKYYKSNMEYVGAEAPPLP